jgi:hypothetical protein
MNNDMMNVYEKWIGDEMVDELRYGSGKDAAEALKYAVEYHCVMIAGKMSLLDDDGTRQAEVDELVRRVTRARRG